MCGLEASWARRDGVGGRRRGGASRELMNIKYGDGGGDVSRWFISVVRISRGWVPSFGGRVLGVQSKTREARVLRPCRRVRVGV